MSRTSYYAVAVGEGGELSRMVFYASNENEALKFPLLPGFSKLYACNAYFIRIADAVLKRASSQREALKWIDEFYSLGIKSDPNFACNVFVNEGEKSVGHLDFESETRIC